VDAFKGIMNTIGTDLGGFTKAIQPINTLFGMIQQHSLAAKEKAALDRSIYYSKHPEAISNMVTGMTKPLSQGLVKGTENIVNASLGEQGLSQAPGIQGQVLAQALAPYQQNEQQMAIAEVFKALGMPAEALAGIQATMRPNDLAAMLKSILPGGGGKWTGGSVGGTSDPALDNPSYMPSASNPGIVFGPEEAPPDPFNLPTGSFGGQ